MRVLVIEDELDLIRALVQSLREEGYAVDQAIDGREGLSKAEACEYDAIVLDLMLPDLSGLDLLRKLRQSRKTPVLILTARDGVSDRVQGLDAGADDYLVKPFELSELLARLRALIRRSAGLADPTIRIGDVAIDTATKTVTRAGEPVTLTAREYALAELLALHRGRLITRARSSTSGSSATMTTHFPTLSRCTCHISARSWAGISSTPAGGWGTRSMRRSLRWRLQAWHGADPRPGTGQRGDRFLPSDTTLAIRPDRRRTARRWTRARGGTADRARGTTRPAARPESEEQADDLRAGCRPPPPRLPGLRGRQFGLALSLPPSLEERYMEEGQVPYFLIWRRRRPDSQGPPAQARRIRSPATPGSGRNGRRMPAAADGCARCRSSGRASRSF